MKRLAKWTLLPAVAALVLAFATPGTARAHGPNYYVSGYYPTTTVVAPWRYPVVSVAPVYRYGVYPRRVYPRRFVTRSLPPVRRVYVNTPTYWVYP